MQLKRWRDRSSEKVDAHAYLVEHTPILIIGNLADLPHLLVSVIE